MTRTIDGQKYWRPDLFHAVAAFIGMLLGVGGAFIALDARYAQKLVVESDVSRLEQSDRELKRELLESLHRIEDRLDRSVRRGVVGADVIPRGD